MTVATVKLHDGRQVRLGRKRPKARPQCLRLAAYLDTSKVSVPPVVDYTAKAMDSLKRVYLNDQYGDCVIASAYHQEGLWSGNDSGTTVVGTDAEVYSMYQHICGPGDNGCNIAEVLDYTRDHGLPFNGVNKKIDGYVSVDWTNKLEVQVAIDLFGSLKLGINLPNDWTCTNCTWRPSNSGIVGGHDVPCVGYNEAGVQIATWGGIVTIIWEAFTSRQWLEEAYCVLAPDWYGDDGLAPSGVKVEELKADLAKIGGGTIPPLPDPPPIPPVPPTPPVPPVPPTPPQTFTIHVPEQPVLIFGVNLGHVPAFTVQGTIGDHAAAIRIPPWLIPLLRLACASAGAIPPPWGMLVGLLCGLLPSAERQTAAGQSIELPPWAGQLLLAILRDLCKIAPNLPAPYSTLAQLLCGLVPPTSAIKGPCGGCS